APHCEGTSVDFLGAIGAGAALARLAPRVGVEAERGPAGVHVVRERLDTTGEADGIRHEPARAVAGDLPAVVDHEVLIARVAHAALGHRVRRLPDELRADVAPEVVPAVPAHRRRAGEAVVERTCGLVCDREPETEAHERGESREHGTAPFGGE